MTILTIILQSMLCLLQTETRPVPGSPACPGAAHRLVGRKVPGIRVSLLALCGLYLCLSSEATLAETLALEQRLSQALGLMQQGTWQQALEVIGELPGSAPLPPVAGRLWYLRGVLAQKLLDSGAARQAFERVWHHYPPLADYAAWEMLQDDAAHDLLASVQKLLATLTERYPFSRFLPESQIVLARTQYRLGQTAPARATLERLLKDGAEHPARPEALALLAQIYEERGEIPAALQTLQRLGEMYPREKQAATALRRSRELQERLPEAQRPVLDPEALLASLERLQEGQLWQEIEARLSSLDKRPLPEALLIKVGLKRGAYELRRGRLNEARALLQDLQQRFPQGSHLAELYYLLGSVYQRQNQTANSLQAYDLALAQPAALPWTARTLWTLARLQEERQEWTRALLLYQRLSQEFPMAEQADDSLWQAGWLQYRQRRYQEALSQWQEFEGRFPRSALLPQVLYWQARAAQQTGGQELASRLWQRLLADYPAHYYSAQAQTVLQAAGGRTAAVVPRGVPTTPMLLHDPTLGLEPTAGASSRPRFHVLRIQELQQLQMYTQAGQELRLVTTLLPSTPAAQYALARLHIDNQQRPTAFRLLNMVVEALSPAEVRGLPREFWTTLYPQVYWPEVSQQAQRTGVNPYLVLSIMRQESAFNPAALSSSGARGLMQLMPATAQEVLTKLKLPPEPALRLFDPQLSVLLGTTYFAGLLQRYQGNVVLALAGYNAGPGRASRWREQWPGIPMDEFTERIPIDETRAYVKLILRNVMLYERLYKS